MDFDILHPKEVNFDKFKFSKTQTNKKVYLSYNYESGNTGRLRIATPWIDLLQMDQNSCLLSLKVMSSEPKMQEIYDFIKTFDKYIINSCKKLNWFESSKEVIKYRKTFLKSISVKEAEEDTNDGWVYPIFKCSTIDAEAFEKNGTPTDLNSLSENQRVKVAIECCGIWFNENKFGTSWRVLQFLVGNKVKSEFEYSFRDSDEEKEENTISYDSEFTDIEY